MLGLSLSVNASFRVMVRVMNINDAGTFGRLSSNSSMSFQT